MYTDTSVSAERNWVFVTNSDFLIPISLQPNVVDLRYFKLWIMLFKFEILRICGKNSIPLFQKTKSILSFSKRLNRSGPIFLWDLAWPQERFMDDQIFKNLPPSTFDFRKFWKSTKFFLKIREIFCFCFFVN